MSRPSTPRVNLPDVVHRKPVQPGPNSWAQSAEKAGVMKIPNSGPATNRDKYENKPMPPLPRASEHGTPPNMSGKPGYIQPATPLKFSNQSTVKNRAVTDPLASKPLLGANKIGELRRKFSGAKVHTNSSSIEAAVRPCTPAPEPSELTAQSSASRENDQSRHGQPPASAPVVTTSQSPQAFAQSQDRQHQSTPAPSRQYGNDDSNGGFILGDGKLNPTRHGTYGSVGEVEYVEGKPEHRVASVAGVIEHAETSSEHELSKSPSARASSSSTSTYRDQNLSYMLKPTVYTPSNYGGVWENDPHVGHTLPPFDPVPPRFPPNPDIHNKNSSEGSRGTIPIISPHEQYGQPSRFSMYPPSVASTNSWAHQQQENPPPSATVPPLFSHNHVPPPPANYRDYEPPSGPLPAELVRLELTLHHHIDSCLGSLSRLVTDKHDQTLDQLLRRFEEQERKVDKALKSAKVDIKEVKQHVETLKSDSRQLQRSYEGLKLSLKDTDAKMCTVDERLSLILSKLQDIDRSFADVKDRVTGVRLTSEGSVGRARRQSVASENPQQYEGPSPTRSQSEHQSPALRSQRQHYQSGTSRSSDGGLQGSTTSRGRRFNPASGGGVSQNGDGRDLRRAYYAEIGASIGDAPDLRQHPAYASQQQQSYGFDANGAPLSMNSDSVLFQMPSFTAYGPHGWYQQAYGG